MSLFGFGNRRKHGPGGGRDDRPFTAYEGADLARRVVERFEHHIERMKSTRRHDRMLRSWRKYYARSTSGEWDTTTIADGGRAGELTLIQPNEFRNLMQHTITLATASPPSYEAVAGNTDSESQAQTILAQGLLDHYHQSKGLTDWRKKRAEVALLFGESLQLAPWDGNAGEAYLPERVVAADGTESERMRYEGDFRFQVLTPYQFAYNATASDPHNPQWLIAFVPFNRHDAATLFPGVREQIMAAPTYVEAGFMSDFTDASKDYDDDIGVYHVWSRRSPAQPNGCDAVILNADTVLQPNVGMGYKRLPAVRCSPADVVLGTGGYTQFFDALPIDDAMAAQISTILSRHTNGGVAPIWTPPKSNASVKDIAPGFKLIQSNFKPEVMDIFKSMPELFTLYDVLRSLSERITVINPALRGDMSAVKGDSGAKTALMHATSAQFSQGFQGSLRRGDEDLGQHIISTIQTHATVERVATLSGRHNTFQARRYDGKSVEKVARVMVHSASPFRDSFMGRQQVIDWYMKLNLIKSPGQLWTAINTGRLDEASEGEQSESLLIRRENEILSDPRSNEVPVVSPMDDHARHIMEHKSNCASPEARLDPGIVRRNMEHTQEHIRALRDLDPGLLTAIGQKPIQPQPPPMPPGPPPEPPGPPGPPPPNAGPPPPPRATGDGGVAMPLPPVNPATGQRADIAPMGA